MARAPEELLDQLLRFIPPGHSGLEPLLAGVAGPLQQAEQAAEDLVQQTTITEGIGKWLDLHGEGLKRPRASGESDESYRRRLRVHADALTRPAIKAVVDELLDTGVAVILEWFEHAYMDVLDDSGMWLNTSLLSGGPNSFIILIEPQAAGGFAAGGFLDNDFWLDGDTAMLGVLEDPVYTAIVNAVNAKKAAGVFYRIVLDT